MNSYIHALVWIRVFLRFTFITFFSLTSIFLIGLLAVSFAQFSFGIFYTSAVIETLRFVYVISIAIGFLLTVSPQGKQIVSKESKEF